MPYSDLFIGILLTLLFTIAAYHLLANNPTAKADRALWHDDRGKLVAIGDHERSQGQLSGTGSQTSGLLELMAGAYRIDYQFDALTRLALIDANGDETLFIKSGSGTEGFTISEAARYRLLLEPSDENAAWQIVYRQISSGAAKVESLTVKV